MDDLLATLDSSRKGQVEAILARSFEPTTEGRHLEQALALVAVRAQGAVACLLEILERSVVRILLRDPDDWTSVMLLDGDRGSHVGVFTSDEQATIASKAYRAGETVRAIDMVLLCRCLQGNVGMAVNPHDEVLSFLLEPIMFAQFRQAVAHDGELCEGEYYSILSGEGYQCLRVDRLMDDRVAVSRYETKWPNRPQTVSASACEQQPRSSCEERASELNRWLPLKIAKVDD